MTVAVAVAYTGGGTVTAALPEPVPFWAMAKARKLLNVLPVVGGLMANTMPMIKCLNKRAIHGKKNDVPLPQ